MNLAEHLADLIHSTNADLQDELERARTRALWALGLSSEEFEAETALELRVARAQAARRARSGGPTPPTPPFGSSGGEGAGG